MKSSDKKYKWSKFWWDDYDLDPLVRLSSFAAQGLWMRMLCIMHRASPRGYLLVNGKTISVAELAALCGKKFKETEKLFEELREKEVFSLSENGIPFCRKMVDQTEKILQSQMVGRLGGNPNLKSGDKGGVNPPLKHQEDRGKKKEEKIIPTASLSGAAAPLPPSDVRSELWKEGLEILQRLTGKSQGACRKFLGEMLKQGKDDVAAAMSALREAQQRRPAEPGSWLMAAMKTRTAPAISPKAQALARIAEEIDAAKKTHQSVATIDGIAEEHRVAGHLENAGSTR